MYIELLPSYCGGVCGVVTQNSNGPCPLISIVNVLSLRGKLSLPQGCEVTLVFKPTSTLLLHDWGYLMVVCPGDISGAAVRILSRSSHQHQTRLQESRTRLPSQHERRHRHSPEAADWARCERSVRMNEWWRCCHLIIYHNSNIIKWVPGTAPLRHVYFGYF